MERIKTKIEKILSKFTNTSEYNKKIIITPNNTIAQLDNADNIENIISDTVAKFNEKENKKTLFDINLYLKMFIHELRTPISSISMGLEILESKNLIANLDQNTINTIYNLKKSIEFVENIFSKFAVIQEGNIKLNTFEPFSLDNLFRNVENLLHYYIKEGEVTFKYEINNDVYDWVYGDKYNIKHSIINLLKNAIKYRSLLHPSVIIVRIRKENKLTIIPHPPPSPNTVPTSTIKSNRKIITNNKQNIVISINDNNEYILPHIKERLFESFNSTSGSGLGLFICKNIIELHGGTIHHNFIKPIGNNFNINLHLETCENQETITKFKEIQRNQSVQRINFYKVSNRITSENSKDNLIINVMIIDDSVLNRKMLYKLLKNNINYNVYTADSGKSAIEKKDFILKNINVIFLDKHMPNMDGNYVANELRKFLYDQLIFGLTGEDNEKENNKFIENGVDFVFIKPINTLKIKMIDDFITKYGTEQKKNNRIKINNEIMEWVLCEGFSEPLCIETSRSSTDVTQLHSVKSKINEDLLKPQSFLEIPMISFDTPPS